MTDRIAATRSIWIVDGGYLFEEGRKRGRFDYLRLKTCLEGIQDADFVDAYFLNSTPNPPTDQQDAFHT